MTRAELEARREREKVEKFLQMAADPFSVYHHKINWDAPRSEQLEQARKLITVTVTVRHKPAVELSVTVRHKPAVELSPEAAKRQVKLAQIAPLVERAHALSDLLLNAWGEWETSVKPGLKRALGPGFNLDIDDLASGDFEFDAARILDHVEAGKQ
jgi:hypothetical protein